MATTVLRTVVVPREYTDVVAVATRPDVLLPIVGGLGRFRRRNDSEDGLGEWDVHLDIGSVHVGGRVVVERPSDNELAWHSIRGTSHRVSLVVEPDVAGSLVTLAITVELVGFLTGRVTELLTRGIVGRHLEAGLQQLRHHVVYGD